MATKISYVDEVWNPVVGCTKCSPGCENCYAEKFAYRLANMGQKKYQKVISTDGGVWNNEIYCDESALDKPLHWRKSRRILCCSMGDLFHEKVPIQFILRLFNITRQCKQHKFYLLTKRIERAAQVYEYNHTSIPNNIHLAVTICNPNELWKIEELIQIPAAHRWISFEPLLDEIDFYGEDGTFIHDFWQGFLMDTNLGVGSYLHQIVVGCESGPNRRECKPEWIKSIVDQCQAAGVKCFVKQMEVNGKVVHDLKDMPSWAVQEI